MQPRPVVGQHDGIARIGRVVLDAGGPAGNQSRDRRASRLVTARSLLDRAMQLLVEGLLVTFQLSKSLGNMNCSTTRSASAHTAHCLHRQHAAIRLFSASCALFATQSHTHFALNRLIFSRLRTLSHKHRGYRGYPDYVTVFLGRQTHRLCRCSRRSMFVKAGEWSRLPRAGRSVARKSRGRQLFIAEPLFPHLPHSCI